MSMSHKSKFRLFQKKDIFIVGIGIAVLELCACLFINLFMFHPVKGQYDENLEGYVDIGTNGISVAARLIGGGDSGKLVLYCHGNAEDITSIDGRFSGLLADGIAVATFDYPGYGLSDGSPCESGCYRNAHRLYDWLVEERQFAPTNIFVVGYSIGTGVAVELAATKPVGGLWLEAAYLSAPRVVTQLRILPVDPFQNMERIRSIQCSLLMIHGTCDSVVPYSHGRKLYEMARHPKCFVSVENADHDNFIYVLGNDKYISMLSRFVKGEYFHQKGFEP